MKKTQNVREGTRKGASRKKKELALALCVSLWMAGGSVALAQYLSIASYDSNNTYPGNVSVSADGKILSVTGGDWSTDWTNFKAGSNPRNYSNYKLNLSNATFEYDGVTLCGTSYHTTQTTGIIRIDGNAVAISDCTFNGKATIYGAYGEYSGQAYNDRHATSYNRFEKNTVTIAGSLGDDHLPKTRFLGATDIYAVFDEIPHNVSGRIIRQPNNLAYSNTVNLYGATAMEKVTLHGYNDQFKTSSSNELHLGGVKGDETVYAPWQGYALDNAGNVTATVNNTVNQIDRVSTIVLHQVYWNTNIPVLKATNGITNTHKMNIADMTFANADEFNAVTSGTTTLLAGTSGNFDTMSVTYKSGTDTATATLDSTTPGVIVQAGTAGSSAASGVTIDYQTGAHTVSLADNFSKVNYTIQTGNYVDTISLGTVSWNKNGTARTAGSGYTFDAGTAINTVNFAFDTPRSIGASDSMTLLAGATGLTAGSNIAHTQGFTQTASGATLTATLSGNITRTAGALGYTATGTALTGVNLTGWNGTTAAVPTGWASGLAANSVTAAGFTAPSATTDILTTDTNNFFSDDYITGALKYSSTTFNNTANGVTLSGGSARGVKASEDGKKLVYHAAGTAGATEVTNISLGEMTWGTGRTLTTTDNFTFDANTAINATNLSFTGTATNAVAPDDSAALLAGATGLTATNPVTGGTGKTVAVDCTDTAGIRFDATATGAVSAAADAVNYTVSGVTLSGVNLAGWNGTGSAVPTGWTAKSGGVDVTAAGFAEPTLGAGQSVDIFTTDTANFFGTVSGAKAYTSGAFTDDEANGVTLSGSHFGGVKKSDDGKTLTYFAETMDVTGVSLGEMAWGTGRAAATGYDFADTATVDATNLTFTNPEAATGSTTLLSGATNLAAGDNIDHTQAFTKSVNGATLSATLTGNVTRTAGEIDYTATGTALTGVTLANWNGATAAVPADWTANLAANSVTAAGFTSPDVAAGASADILTTDTADFFSDDQITGAMKYKADAESSDTMNGVMLSGTESKGVKASADGKNLVYARSDFNVSGISLGEMEWGTPRTMAATGYDFANTATVDATNLTFTNPEAATGSTTLLSGAAGLTAGDNIAHAQAFTKSVNGATLSATLTGNVTRTAGEIGYTATGTALTGVNLANWNGTAAAVPADWTANLAANSVTAAGFTAPTQTTDILTTNTPSFFTDDQITGAMKYAPSTSSSDEANGVTLTGAESKGVKATDGGKKLVYARSNFNVSEISFGKMAWGTGRTAAAGYDFSNTATIDASGLTFSDPEAVTGNMTLLSGAANLAAGKTVAGANHSQNISAKANGATLSGTLNGTVATTAGAVNYTFGSKTLSGVNLANWNGTTTALAGWTSGLTDNSITAAGFTAPTLAAGASADILTTTTNNFFNDDRITGAMKYKADAESSDTMNGVMLSGTELKGVKASADGKNLVYARSDFNVSGISLGEMEWGTPRTMAATGYDFADTATVDATNLTFTNPETATGSTTLLSGAAGLTAGDNIAHAQAFTKSVNGATLSATLTGNVTRTAAGEIGYTATGTTLSGVNLANWNGTTASVPTGWTSNLGANSVTAEGFTAPTQTTDILTTNTPSFFNDDQITGAMKYAAGAESSDTVNGVTLTGAESKGVKASDDGKNLVYARSNFNVSNISFGEMTWGAARDGSAAGYDYANADVDLSRFTFTNPETVTAGTTTLLQANDTLSAVLSDVAKPFSYQYTPVAGVIVDGVVNGSVSQSGNNIVYTATENKAGKLTFGDVEWKDAGALLARPANITFAGADVNTANINFTNIQSLDAGRKMTLVSDFGDTVGTITGDAYKVGSTLEGKGRASLSGSDLIFTAETGTMQEQAHNTVMGAEVGMAALSAGNDFIGAATEGLALTANVGADGVSSYANMGGGSMRQETGSHVDVHTWNAILALGHKNKKERGTMEYGAFFEYGSGNYTTYNGDERGDGSTHYTGGGLLAKWTAKHGLYVEGSLRAGSVHDDARNVLRDANGAPYSYETDAPYMGFHLGVGKIIPFDDVHSLDVYGKYFYNRRNGVSFDAGGHYDLDAVTSQVVRVGARYTIKQRKWNFYASATYEHELDGVAGGTADSVAIRGADTGGASFRGEIGATMNPGEKSPWSLGLNVSGFAGKKQGVSGGVSVSFMF